MSRLPPRPTQLKPYYDDGKGIVIYCGDNRFITPKLQSFDLLLTDPPYGLGEAAGKNKSRSKIAISKDYGDESWDDCAPDKNWIDLIRSKATKQIIWGGNYFELPPSSCWLVWDKENGETDFADCELAWTNFNKAVRIKRHQWHGMLRKGKEERFHPTQKPIDVIRWCITKLYPDCETIFDPFMGSGTTLRAAKDLGKRCVGIEQSEKYCETAAIRLQQEVLL